MQAPWGLKLAKRNGTCYTLFYNVCGKESDHEIFSFIGSAYRSEAD